jgi:hypothetical protein
MCVIDPTLVPHGQDRPCPTLDRMLSLAAARPESAVAVTGPASLPVLIGLCRKGYDRVTCARAATSCADGLSDVLLVSGPCSGEALSQALRGTLRLLKDGGVIVAHEGGLDDDLVLAGRLETMGFALDWCVHDLSAACLTAVRVRRRLEAVSNVQALSARPAFSRAA